MCVAAPSQTFGKVGLQIVIPLLLRYLLPVAKDEKKLRWGEL
jgi:hypothetical protein